MKLKPKPNRSAIQRHNETIAYGLACIAAASFFIMVVGTIITPVIWFVLRNVIHLHP